MHSLDSYFQRTTAPKSAAQERREEFHEKVMRSADYIADKFVETVRPLVDEVADKLQSEMPEDMESPPMDMHRWWWIGMLRPTSGTFHHLHCRRPQLTAPQ